jgi:hypothetical protein
MTDRWWRLLLIVTCKYIECAVLNHCPSQMVPVWITAARFISSLSRFGLIRWTGSEVMCGLTPRFVAVVAVHVIPVSLYLIGFAARGSGKKNKKMKRIISRGCATGRSSRSQVVELGLMTSSANCKIVWSWSNVVDVLDFLMGCESYLRNQPENIVSFHWFVGPPSRRYFQGHIP